WFQGVGKRLQGEVSIGSDSARSERVIEVTDEISQGRVEPPFTGALPFDGLLQPLVEKLDLVPGQRRKQNRLGGIPAVQRGSGHAGLFGNSGQSQLDRAPGRNRSPRRLEY